MVFVALPKTVQIVHQSFRKVFRVSIRGLPELELVQTFGGSSIVRGTIYGVLSANQTVSFSTLTVENAVVLIATTEITSISNSSFTYVPVFFENLLYASVSFQTWLKDVCFPLPVSKLPCTFETRFCDSKIFLINVYLLFKMVEGMHKSNHKYFWRNML